MKILIGIVLYNPNLIRLNENIDKIELQGYYPIFVNNGSKNIGEIIKILRPHYIIINNDKNMGIATALNQILQNALDNNYDWVLTLDQDSVISDNLISIYLDVISGKERLGMVCCKIKDRNAVILREENSSQNDNYLEECITSGSMVNVEAWRKVGGFDDAMFIDGVDFDFCMMLRKNGWHIFKTFKTFILHEVGHSRTIKILGKEYLSLNHSTFRYFYIVRNCIYLGRKHHHILRSLRITVRTYWTVIRFERQKYIKLKLMNKGFLKGFTFPITKPQERIKNNEQS